MDCDSGGVLEIYDGVDGGNEDWKDVGNAHQFLELFVCVSDAGGNSEEGAEFKRLPIRQCRRLVNSHV